MTPVFLFSLPRAGSTLLQRILGAHEDIATTSEPWILLPFFYTLKPAGVYSEYSHSAATLAIEDFCRLLPAGQADYRNELHDFAMRLFQKAARRPARYFLDKTPRYHLIADEIVDSFPEAKFIFLWRNPLAVLASIVDTFLKGKWNVHDYKIDLFDGVDNLVRARARAGNRAITLRYEDLIERGAESVSNLLKFLELPDRPELIEKFSTVELHGRVGDYTGTKDYSQLSREPLEKWKSVLNNPLRRAWARRYLNWIGAERMVAMGYSLQPMLDELNALSMTGVNLGPDFIQSIYGILCEIFEPEIIKRKLALRHDWRKIHVHR